MCDVIVRTSLADVATAADDRSRHFVAEALAMFARIGPSSLAALAVAVAAASRAVAGPPPVGTSIVQPHLPLLAPSPSPSPAAFSLKTRFGPRVAGGGELTSFAGRNDATIIIIGGKEVTLGAVRAGTRSASLRHLGPPQVFLRSESLHRTLLHPTVREQKRSVPAPSGFTLGPHPVSLSGTLVNHDPNYCATHPPYILNADGKITPGGYVTVNGVCLGAMGSLRLEGRFDGGALTLAIQHWDDDTIFAAVPSVTGVFDQAVKLQLVSGTTTSNELPLDFTAARERLPLPTRFIFNDSCDIRAISPAQCLGGTGFRMDISDPKGGGLDSWSVTTPPGWVLDELDSSSSLGSVTQNGFATRAGNRDDFAAWQMLWTVGFQKAVTHAQDGGFFGGLTGDTYSWTDDYYGSAYAMTVYAVGPVGTMPP